VLVSDLAEIDRMLTQAISRWQMEHQDLESPMGDAGESGSMATSQGRIAASANTVGINSGFTGSQTQI